MFEKILAATDGSEHGLRAAKVAVELGKISGGKVFAVYVADTQRTAHLPDDMLLFSIKELLLKEGKEAIKQVQELAEKNGVDFDGAVVEGKVKSLSKFGAFITLPDGSTGMVHISEIAHAYVNDIRDHLTEGQDVKVMIISRENGKTNLSIKRTLPPPAKPSGHRRP